MGSKKQRGKKLAIISGAIILVGGALAYPFFAGKEDKPTIKTATVERGTVTSTVSASGVLQALTTVDVKSNVGGQVVKLTVDEGDRVKAGQLIAQIDPADTLTSLKQQQADLASAKAKVSQARTQRNMTKEQNTAQLRSAQQALEGAKQRLAQAETQARLQPTLTSTSIKQAESTLRSARSAKSTTVKQAESALRNAESALKQTRDVLIPQKLAAVQAEYDQAQANLEYASTDLTRQKELLAKGFVSKSTVDAAEQRQRVAKAQAASAQKKFTTATTDTKEDLIAAENKVEQARAALEETTSTAQAKVDQAEAALESAQANSAQDNIRLQDAANARASLRQAEAALESAKAGLAQNDIRENDIIQANSQVIRTLSAVDNAVTQLGYTKITAPRGGVVVKKYVDEGSIVSAGRNSSLGTGAGVTIIQIADTNRMFAVVNVDETDIAQISVGQTVDVTVDAYPDELFDGRVTKIAPQAITEQNVTTIPVTVEIDNPDLRLKPDMNVNCEFVVAKHDDVLYVPNEAIKETDDGSTVQVLEKGQPVTKPVEVGLAGNDNTEIESGLTEGDTVITAIIQPQKPGASSTPRGGMGGPMGGGMGGGRRR